MPLPKPNDGESQDDFIGRCMGEIAEEFPDEQQRMAVCQAQWEAQHTRSMEYRGMPDGTEMRVIENGVAPRIEGLAAVFNKLSQPLGFGFRERILPGAFTQTIKNGDVRALFNHDPNFVLGRTKAKTLELFEDETGLRFVAHPPDEPWVHSLITSIKRGDINQASFSFQTLQESWSESGKTRELREVKLFDVSPVTYPAYLDTVVQARDVKQAVAQALKAMSEPGQSHSDEPNTEPGQSHSEEEPVKARKMSVLVKEWRLAHEAGESTLKQEEKD